MSNGSNTFIGGIVTNNTDETMTFDEVIDMQGSWQQAPPETIGKKGATGSFVADNHSGPTSATVIYRLDSGAVVSLYFFVAPCPTMPVYRVSCRDVSVKVYCDNSHDECANGQPYYFIGTIKAP